MYALDTISFPGLCGVMRRYMDGPSLDSKPLRKAAWYTLFTHVYACARITQNLGNRKLQYIYQYSYSALVCKTLISVSFIMMSLKKEI